MYEYIENPDYSVLIGINENEEKEMISKNIISDLINSTFRKIHETTVNVETDSTYEFQNIYIIVYKPWYRISLLSIAVIQLLIYNYVFTSYFIIVNNILVFSIILLISYNKNYQNILHYITLVNIYGYSTFIMSIFIGNLQLVLSQGIYFVHIFGHLFPQVVHLNV